MDDFSHFDPNGRAKMVDISGKPETARTALASAAVQVNQNTFSLIRSGGLKKGDVLATAQIAGIMGAKHTADLIPMCHPVALSGIELAFQLDEPQLTIHITANVRCTGRTGVEMEALTAVSIAALTIYDMCKAVQRDIVIRDLHLLSKTGGVHGDYQREVKECLEQQP